MLANLCNVIFVQQIEYARVQLKKVKKYINNKMFIEQRFGKTFNLKYAY